MENEYNKNIPKVHGGDKKETIKILNNVLIIGTSLFCISNLIIYYHPLAFLPPEIQEIYKKFYISASTGTIAGSLIGLLIVNTLYRKYEKIRNHFDLALVLFGFISIWGAID